MGGGTALPCPALPRLAGLSPRGRGNPDTGVDPAIRDGSIPAWAGEPVAVGTGHCTSPVYPRVGGGTHVAHVYGRLVGGLSPRGRGNRVITAAQWAWNGSIPAWAGEPYINIPRANVGGVYPRVGGGTAL